MKLQLVPARHGMIWVRQGIRTFLRQPLAMAGLFFMFMAVVSVLSVVPLLGTALSLALVPAATVGLMAATREAANGRFPMPTTLVIGFRSGTACTRSLLVLGGLYAMALLLVVGAALVLGSTGDSPAEINPAEVSPEAVQAALSSPGMWAALLLYLPVTMAFWHAPALVLWNGVSPVKSLFFSIAACWGNRWAMLSYALGWTGVFLLASLITATVGGMLGGAEVLGLIVYPMALFMASMFHTSIFFTYRDSFLDAGPTAAPESLPGDNTP